MLQPAAEVSRLVLVPGLHKCVNCVQCPGYDAQPSPAQPPPSQTIPSIMLYGTIAWVPPAGRGGHRQPKTTIHNTET